MNNKMGYGEKRYIIVVATRPDTLKLSPIIKELRRRGISLDVWAITQHHNLLIDNLKDVGVMVDHLIPLERGGSLVTRMAKLATLVEAELQAAGAIAGVFIYGDTYSAKVVGEVSFFNGIPVHHVEAGLRSNDKNHPKPEEYFRRCISSLCDVGYAPTEEAASNLIRERQDCQTHVVGNPVIDLVAERIPEPPVVKNHIIITLHRGESIGEPLQETLKTLGELATEYPELEFLLITHPNPAVLKFVMAYANSLTLKPPTNYNAFLPLVASAKGIITDSGGVQEEAAYLGVPTLVVRKQTERPEVLQGSVKLSYPLSKNDFKDWIIAGEGRRGHAEFTLLGKGDTGEQIAKIVTGE